MIRMSVCLIAAVLFLGTAAPAAERPYYQGKNITFFINFSAGGPTDIEGRIVARHLARHIPGNPAIVEQNMSGGGGVTGINYLGEVAKHDGLTLGYFTGPFYYHDVIRPDGTMAKSPDYPELNSFTEVYTQIFAKPRRGSSTKHSRQPIWRAKI